MQQQQKRARDLFIGRHQESAAFTQWLADTSPNAPWIFHLYDAAEEKEKKGGVGKTWLLRHFAELARHAHPTLAIVMVDFFNVTDRDRIVIAERVVEGLQTAFPNWSPSTFRTAVDEYRTGSYRSGLHPERDVADVRVRDTLSDALASDLRNLESYLAKTKKALLLLFDTFELIEQSPVIAVLGVGRTFPDNYGFKRISVVIAGRNELDWTHPNWRDREKEIHSLALAPFDEQEMLEYIDAESVDHLPIQPEQTQALYRLTEGRPILIGLATDVLNHRTTQIEGLISVPRADFEARLVTEINNLENPLNWVILFMAHVYHRFNMNILGWIVRESNLKYATQQINYAQLVASLPELSFVRRSISGDDFVLHDEMRRLVTKYCWVVQDTDQRNRKEISRRVIGYCEQALAQSKSLSEQERQVYIIEKLYHSLFLDVAQGLVYFQEEFTRAVNSWSGSFARSLLQEALSFVDKMSSDQRNDMILAEMKLLRTEENPAVALEVYQQLEKVGNDSWGETHKADLLFEQGRCYLQLSRFSQATQSLEAALEVERAHKNKKREASLLGLLGYVHRRLGQFDRAMDYYEESVGLFRETGNQVVYAETLNNISNVHRLQGRMEEALRVCKLGVSIRRRLVQEGRTTERAVGLSLSTLGMIYFDSDRIVPAEQALREALEIYNRTGFKKGLAAAYNRLGQVQMEKGDFEQAKSLFEKAQAIATEVDSESFINSLNKQGHILAQQEKWKEAIPFFERAIQVARQVHDHYQQAESLIDLARSLEFLGEHTQAQPLWEEAKELSSRDNYIYLLGQAEEAQGDVALQAGSYMDGFERYREYCRYMAHYNILEYNRAIAKISDELLKVPVDLVPAILDRLVSSWSALELAKDYPELIEACEEMRGLMVL